MKCVTLHSDTFILNSEFEQLKPRSNLSDQKLVLVSEALLIYF